MQTERHTLSPAQIRAARMRGNATLVATIVRPLDALNAAARINAECAGMEDDIRLRDMRRLGFGQRASYCG